MGDFGRFFFKIALFTHAKKPKSYSIAKPYKSENLILFFKKSTFSKKLPKKIP